MTALPTGWESQVLAGIGAPNVASDVQVLDLWQTAEGGSTNNPDAYNPMNTTRNTDTAGRPLGGTPTNSAGVLAFPSWGAGLSATVATLEQPNMAGIRQDLVGGAPVATTEAAIASSPWGTHSFPGQATDATLAGAFPGGSLDPLNWPGEATAAAAGLVSDALGNVAKTLYSTVVKGGVVLLGAGLIVLAGATAARKSVPGAASAEDAAGLIPLAALA